MSNMKELPRHPGKPPESWGRMAQYEDCPTCAAPLWSPCVMPLATSSTANVNLVAPCCPARIDAARQRFTEEWILRCEERAKWLRRPRFAEGSQQGNGESWPSLLLRYGDHADDCYLVYGDHADDHELPAAGEKCTCGWDGLVEALS